MQKKSPLKSSQSAIEPKYGIRENLIVTMKQIIGKFFLVERFICVGNRIMRNGIECWGNDDGISSLL
jgi:hypothetical protein